MKTREGEVREGREVKKEGQVREGRSEDERKGGGVEEKVGCKGVEGREEDGREEEGRKREKQEEGWKEEGG